MKTKWNVKWPWSPVCANCGYVMNSITIDLDAMLPALGPCPRCFTVVDQQQLMDQWNAARATVTP